MGREAGGVGQGDRKLVEHLVGGRARGLGAGAGWHGDARWAGDVG